MKRRDFLKGVPAVLLVPSVLATMPKQRWMFGGQQVGKSVIPKEPEKFVGQSVIDWVMYDEDPAPWLSALDIAPDNHNLHKYIHWQFICSHSETNQTFEVF